SRTVSRRGRDSPALLVRRERARGLPRWAPSPRLDQPFCPPTSWGGAWGGGGGVVLGIRVVAHRRLCPTISASTRCAVRFSPECLSVQVSVVTVPCTKTGSPSASAWRMFSPRVLTP